MHRAIRTGKTPSVYVMASLAQSHSPPLCTLSINLPRESDFYLQDFIFPCIKIATWYCTVSTRELIIVPLSQSFILPRSSVSFALLSWYKQRSRFYGSARFRCTLSMHEARVWIGVAYLYICLGKRSRTYSKNRRDVWTFIKEMMPNSPRNRSRLVFTPLAQTCFT